MAENHRYDNAGNQSSEAAAYQQGWRDMEARAADILTRIVAASGGKITLTRQQMVMPTPRMYRWQGNDGAEHFECVWPTDSEGAS